MKQPITEEEWHLYKFGMSFDEAADKDREGKAPICKVCGLNWNGHAGHHCVQRAEEMGLSFDSEKFQPIDMPEIVEELEIELEHLSIRSTIKNVFEN
jgi:hypothetical protein